MQINYELSANGIENTGQNSSDKNTNSIKLYKGNNMKKLLIIVFTVLNFTNLKAQWELCNDGIYGGEFYCFLIDSNNLYTGIAHAGVFMTTDNGDIWNVKNNGLKGPYGYEIHSLAIRENRIFVGTGMDGIYLSTDKGENWVHKSEGLPYYNNDWICGVSIDVIIINGNNIYAGTDKGIYLSTDNGDNWIAKNNGLPPIDKFMFVNSMAVNGNNIYAGTYSGIYISSDNGNNWSLINNGIENLAVLSLATYSNNIYAGTLYGGIYLSTDNGDNWKYICMKDTTIDVLLINGRNIFASGYGINLSTNNGNSWTAFNTGFKYLRMQCIVIKDEYVFVAIWHDGVYRAKLSDLGITDIVELEQIENQFQIYPNPSTDFIELNGELINENSIIRIFNLYGIKLIEIPYSNKIDVKSLPSGIYFLEVENKYLKFIKM